jgi:myo-inositol-1(or 4)-monophosphatase
LADLPVGASGKTALVVARQAASAASDIMLAAYRKPIQKTAKGRGDFLTEFDVACERAALGLLAEEYPDVPVIGEETSSAVNNWREGWLWVVDPIDGTSNFTRGIPTFAFNIGLCYNGDPVLGLTLQPVTGDEFLAVDGEGLTVNSTQTRIADVERLEDALLGFGLGYMYSRSKKILGMLADLWPGVQMAQNIGSAALGLSYTASGRFDVYVHSLLAPWDMVAGIIQVREAGGLALDRAGEPVTIYSEGIVAGAPGPVRELVAATKDRDWR